MVARGQIVDSHAHLIANDPERYPYASIDGELPEWLHERAVDAELLSARMDQAGVGKAVLVQFAHVHGYDNSYVIDAATQHPDRFAAVCCIDPNDPDVSATMNAWAERGAAGFRMTAADPAAPPDWVLTPGVWERAIQLELPLVVHFHVQNQAEGIPRLDRMLDRYKREPVVVLDHAGNPPFHQGPPAYGLGPLLDLARFETLHLKFSTVNFRRLAEASVDPEPILRRLIDRFGARRIMWGSDAPNSPGDYGDLLSQMQAALGSFGQIEEDWIMGETALAVFPRLRGTGRSVTGW